ncbi:hypothetical protein GJAV_G00101500 [Gymnothorax javanicus]|nr:hypothetical protein GJAV_G00101500 [Gymnothorax javanicus]
MDNIYSDPDIPSFPLEHRQDVGRFMDTNDIYANTEGQEPGAKQSTAVGQYAKKRDAPCRYLLALLAVLCIALLGGLIAMGVLNCCSENVSFQSGMELRIKGVPKPNPVRFTIDVGQSEQMLALHFDLRFNYAGTYRTIVLNSFENGNWKEEQRESNFPFEAGQEFEITISVTSDNFFINLTAGNTIKFPNRLGDKHYHFLSLEGDVEVKSISLK